ncbi:MAG: septum formation initiator family protein [Candidatus Vogelbacteria bacterium]|nr:septum formation initiator family protein [Candidatus Vogelbacteria bacterium]
MANYQGKRHRISHLSPLVLAILVIVLVIFVRATWGVYQKSRLAEENLQASVKKLQEITQRKKDLQESLERFKTARGIEEEIRTNLSVVKNGEKVINIMAESDTATTATSTDKKPNPWWHFW